MRLAAAAALALLALPAAAEITAARFSAPNDRYDHDILGETPDWGALDLSLTDGRTLRYRLPEALVFEDIEPRLADLDGDGAPEVIVVEASPARGARLAVWGETGRVAAGPHYGQPHRWLAPLGAADLDGDGRVEIAYIDRPHLAKVLVVVRLDGGRLVPLAEAPGLTNHRIGDALIQGGIAWCGAGAVIVTATADWTGVAETRFDGRRLTTRVVGPYEGPESLERRLGCN